jgi:hypothetical protein
VHLTSVHLMGGYLMGVHLTGVHLMDVHLMDVYLMDVYLMGEYFMSMHLTGVHLTGVHYNFSYDPPSASVRPPIIEFVQVSGKLPVSTALRTIENGARKRRRLTNKRYLETYFPLVLQLTPTGSVGGWPE